MSHIHLVITIALAAELPPDWRLQSNTRVPILYAHQLQTHHDRPQTHTGWIIVITGTGGIRSRKAAIAIHRYVKPHYVINLGTCGQLNKNLPLKTWCHVQHVCDTHHTVSLPHDLPISWPSHIPYHVIHRLYSANEPIITQHQHTRISAHYVDMEAASQATVFANTNTTFHCIKWLSDNANQHTNTTFKNQLSFFHQDLTSLFNHVFFKKHRPSTDITVIMPAHGRLTQTRRAIQSIWKQSTPPARLIVIDDGGTLTSKLPSWPHTDVLPLTPTKGVSAARNHGIQCAKTDWLCFLDNDDYWCDTHLETLCKTQAAYPFYRWLQAPEQWVRHGQPVQPQHQHVKHAGWLFNASLARCMVSPSSVMIHRDIVQHVGLFNETLPACEDYDLWLRIARHYPIGLTQTATVVKHGGHSDQLSRRYIAMDQYRIYSLIHLLHTEKNPTRQSAIMATLRTKMDILYQGAQKNGTVTKGLWKQPQHP